MKKTLFITLVMFASFGASVQAQIVSSQSNQVIVHEVIKPKIIKPKKPRSFRWNIRAGYSIDNMNHQYTDNTNGYDFSVGIVKDFEIPNLLWGVDLGLMSHSIKNKGKIVSTSEIDISPYIGYIIPIRDNVSVVPYVGPYFGYQWGFSYFDATFAYGVNAGIEFFITKGLYVDFHYKQGLNSSYDDGKYEDLKASKIVFGLGYQF